MQLVQVLDVAKYALHRVHLVQAVHVVEGVHVPLDREVGGGGECSTVEGMRGMIRVTRSDEE